MVLKRLLVTTLGALGLGALAAGPASAQQIPAPDLFDDQVACSSNVPSGMANAPLCTALGMAIKDGEVITDTDGDGVPDAGSDFVGLNYIIPPGNSNCGGGTYSQAEFDAAETALGSGMAGFEVGGPKPVTGPIAKDVAAGYTQTLGAYLDVRAADAAVKTAKAQLKVLTDALEAGAADTPSITAARETLATAESTQTAAHSNLYAVGAGPVNMAGIAEWRAKFAVEDAVKAYNMAVAMASTAGSGAQLGDLDYGGYVPLRDETASFLTDMVIDDAGNVNLARLREYANAEGTRTATQDAVTGAITGDGNFDNAARIDELLKETTETTTNMDADGNPVTTTTTTESGRIVNIETSIAGDTALGVRIDTEETARMAGDEENAMGIMTNAGNIMANEMSIGANASAISSNVDAIAANMSSIGSNTSAISDNRNMIGELSDDLDVVRAGVAASMALAGMPAINGRGISIGVGSFDGESAFAVGFQIQGEMASFKVGLTSGGGATGASAGVGFQF